MKLRRTTVMMVFCGALLAGLGASVLTDRSLHVSWLIISTLFLVISWRSKSVALIMSVAFLGLVAGWFRGGVYMRKLQPYADLNGRRVVLQVRAENDATYDQRRQLSFDAGEVLVLKPYETELPGRVKVSGFGIPGVNRGDVVSVEGKLFRTRGSRQASIGFAEMRLVDEEESRLEQVRRDFVAGSANALPEPHASFGLGLLIGQRSNLPERTLEELSAAGLTHIIAVSGYNLTIIIGFVRRLMSGRSKYQTVMAATLLTAAFLFFTGFSASIVRASIVSGLGLLAWYYGRAFRPVLLLLLTAALTAMWYPPYLWSDIGWYLSFLAFYGVLVLAPLLTRRFMRRKPKLLGNVIIESLCAQVMTWPLILFIFGESSTVALISNAVIVPLVPLAMLVSLVAGTGGMLFPLIASWFGLPARVILTYILDMVSLLAGIPHARMSATVSLTGMIVLYAALVGLSVVLWRRGLRQHATITEINTGA